MIKALKTAGDIFGKASKMFPAILFCQNSHYSKTLAHIQLQTDKNNKTIKKHVIDITNLYILDSRHISWPKTT